MFLIGIDDPHNFKNGVLDFAGKANKFIFLTFGNEVSLNLS